MMNQLIELFSRDFFLVGLKSSPIYWNISLHIILFPFFQEKLTISKMVIRQSESIPKSRSIVTMKSKTMKKL